MKNAALYPDLIRSGDRSARENASEKELELPFRPISTGRLRKARPMYRICEVDGHDDHVADTLADLHRLTFFDGASIPKFDQGHWWLAFFEAMPVAFAGLVPSTRAGNAGYFSRVGVLQKHCGNRLQLRLMRAMETRAKHNGWSCVVSDTTDNLASANNFIRAGYRLYQPQYPWGWPNTLYWRKSITCPRPRRKPG
jgi:Acetyltransferase (GNAT) family